MGIIEAHFIVTPGPFLMRLTRTGPELDNFLILTQFCPLQSVKYETTNWNSIVHVIMKHYHVICEFDGDLI